MDEQIRSLLVQTIRPEEANRRMAQLGEHLKREFNPENVNWWRDILGFLNVMTLNRILYFDELYQKIIEVPGVIVEFGTNYGGGTA